MKITIAIECHSVEEARHTLDQLGGREHRLEALYTGVREGGASPHRTAAA